MDKLEKALEKARRERASSVKPSSAPNFVTTPSFAQHNSPSNVVEVAESHLEQHRILAHHQRNPEADIFRILRTQVLQIMNKSDLRTLAITSPRYGDGKSTIALNLALSIALDLKQTVLLVDLDFRKPTLDLLLGLQDNVGLTDHLLKDVPLADCLARLPFERLRLLPGGRALDNSSEVLGSPKMAALAQEIKGRYNDRFVIYDMPPVLAQDDSIAFLPHVDATLIVVRDGRTKVNDLKTCVERLSGANIIGTILNNAAQH